MTPDEMIGSVSYFGGNFPPKNTAICNGAVIAITSNQPLYSIIGSFFGGDGRATMGLPDMRGRAILGVGAAPHLTERKLAQKIGTEKTTVRLEEKHLPAHTHTVSFDSAALNSHVTTTAILRTLAMTVTLRCNSSAGGAGPLQGYPGTNASSAVWATSASDPMAAATIRNASVYALNLKTQFSTSANGGQPITLENTGSGTAFTNSNMPAYTTLTCVIALEGEYPQRS